MREVRLQIGDYYYNHNHGYFDQAANWYEKVVRKEKLEINQDKSDRIKYAEDLYKLKSALRQQGDYYFRQSNFDQAANWYERLVTEERVKFVEDRADRLKYKEDLSKLKPALHRQMEEKLLTVSQFLGFGQNTDLKALLRDPKFFLKDVTQLRSAESKDKLEKAKEKIKHFENIQEYFKNILQQNATNREFDYLFIAHYFFKGLIDEAENNFISADSAYEKIENSTPLILSHFNERRKQFFPNIPNVYFYETPLNWVRAKHLYEIQERNGNITVDLFLNLAYIHAKFNTFSASYEYFKKAHELLQDTDLKKTIEQFRNKGRFFYPDDLTLIPQKVTNQYPILHEMSFIETKDLLKVLGIEVIARSDGFIGKTHIKTPVDIVIRSAGNLVGDYGHILINGKNVSQNNRGYNIAVLNPKSGEIEKSESFDTCGSREDVGKMINFINNIEESKIVCVAVADDASEALSEKDGRIFDKIGAKGNVYRKHRWGHGIIGIKGAKYGEAIEAINEKPLEIYVISQKP